MKNPLPIVVLLCIALGLMTACASSGPSSKKLKSGDRPIYIDLSTLEFTAHTVDGQVQIKTSRKGNWRDLQPGETFNGLASIRTGFRSKADLVMNGATQPVNCRVGSLLCATSMRDVYGRVLHPEAIKEYRERLWGDDDAIDPDAPILVTRASLKGEEKETLLAEAAGSMNVRTQEGGAAAAGGGGAAGGGSGGGGGGCAGGS